MRLNKTQYMYYLNQHSVLGQMQQVTFHKNVIKKNNKRGGDGRGQENLQNGPQMLTREQHDIEQQRMDKN